MIVQGTRCTFFFIPMVLLSLSCATASADLKKFSGDGWHTWRIAAIQSAPNLCCFNWNRGVVTGRGCDLDNHRDGFITDGENKQQSGEMQIYALMKSGQVSDVRAFHSNCPVTAEHDITDLGHIDTDDSVHWLEPLLSKQEKLNSGVVTAIAMHSGKEAGDILIETSGSHPSQGVREEAIFWMAQVRIGETEASLKQFIFDDKNPDIREHAAFSYSQSDAADIAEVLISQGQKDASSDVRSQAWFWLAETGADESEKEIRNAMLNDKDAGVREEAVFALSQLPEDRAVDALIAIVNDPKLDFELRENALFWLAQSESDEAFELIDRLLSAN